MEFEEVKRFINSHGPIPTPESGFREDWLYGRDLANLLLDSTNADVPVYLNHSFVETDCFLLSILVSNNRLAGDFINDIMKWNFSCDYSWGYSRLRSEGEKVYSICPPLGHTGSEVLDGSEPIVFHRFFEGHEKSSYLEVNQKITQILDVHFVEERGAFCRFDENGDYEDVIILDDENNLCTIKKSDLDLLMLITDSTLVRVYDFTRIVDRYHMGDYSDYDVLKVGSQQNTQIFGRRGFWSNGDGEKNGSNIRGFQTITISEPLEILKKRADREFFEGKYESFISHDFKNKKVHDCSCDPKELDSYYTDTGKPFQTTPAFFNADVLTKYKQHPEKYVVTPESIQCRGAWTLKRYDVNPKGQIDVFLCDLSLLPYKEQQYWKCFNEQPRAGISSKSITQDFKGEFSDEYDALISLSHNLLEYPLATHSGNEVTIWEFRGDQAKRKTSQLHYVITESPKEWETQILELSRIIVDGLNVASLRGLAQHLKCDDPKFGSIKLLGVNLQARTVDQIVVESILKPIIELNDIRSKCVAHAGKSIPKGDLRVQFADLLKRIDGAMLQLRTLIEKGVFDI